MICGISILLFSSLMSSTQRASRNTGSLTGAGELRPLMYN